MTSADHAADDELAAVLAGEAELLRPECRADAVRLRELLHPDFREHGASGTVWTLDSVIADLVADTTGQPRRQPVDLRAYRLAPDVALVTYRVTGTRPSLRSSLWLRTGDGRWQLRFHQGTCLPTGPEADPADPADPAEDTPRPGGPPAPPR